MRLACGIEGTQKAERTVTYIEQIPEPEKHAHLKRESLTLLLRGWHRDRPRRGDSFVGSRHAHRRDARGATRLGGGEASRRAGRHRQRAAQGRERSRRDGHERHDEVDGTTRPRDRGVLALKWRIRAHGSGQFPLTEVRRIAPDSTFSGRKELVLRFLDIFERVHPGFSQIDVVGQSQTGKSALKRRNISPT